MEHQGAGWLAAIEQSGFGQYVRDAVLLYPLANVAHVLAVLVFFAAIAVMDFRLLGWLSGEPAGPVVRRWRRVAVIAFVLIAASGTVLFVPEATAVAPNTAFQAKLALIAVGLVNVVVVTGAMRGSETVPGIARLGAGLSLLLWLMTAACGRFIAYA